MDRSCAFCCNSIVKLKRCEVCKVTIYCSRECRERNWNEHRKHCDYHSKNDKLDHEEKYLRSKPDLNRLIHALDTLSKPKSLTVIPRTMIVNAYVVSSVEARGFVVCNDKLVPNTVYYVVADGVRRYKRSKYSYINTVTSSTSSDTTISNGGNSSLVELLQTKYPNIVDLAIGKVFVVYDPKPNDTIVDSVYVYDVQRY